MVSEVLKYVAEETSYSVTVFGLRFDILTDRDAIWRNFVNAGRGAIWRHFGTTERLKFNILLMLKISVPLLQKTRILYSGLESLTAVCVLGSGM
jgi:hypothetical protein